MPSSRARRAGAGVPDRRASSLGGEPCALVLGDNLFYRPTTCPSLLRAGGSRPTGATVFAYQVRDPERYGVVDIRRRRPRLSNRREAGRAEIQLGGDRALFLRRHSVREMAARVQARRARGELEITDLNRLYLEDGTLHVERLGRGFAWLDAGTPDSCLQAATFVQTIQSRQGMLVGCPEEVAFRMGWIDADDAARPCARARQDRTRPRADRSRRRELRTR